MNNKRIEKLERDVIELGMSAAGVPGTSFTRVCIKKAFAGRYGISIPKGQDEVLAWSLGIGGAASSKSYFYGTTMLEALKRAEDFVEKRLKRERAAKDRRIGAVHRTTTLV